MNLLAIPFECTDLIVHLQNKLAKDNAKIITNLLA